MKHRDSDYSPHLHTQKAGEQGFCSSAELSDPPHRAGRGQGSDGKVAGRYGEDLSQRRPCLKLLGSSTHNCLCPPCPLSQVSEECQGVFLEGNIQKCPNRSKSRSIPLVPGKRRTLGRNLGWLLPESQGIRRMERKSINKVYLNQT